MHGCPALMKFQLSCACAGWRRGKRRLVYCRRPAIIWASMRQSSVTLGRAQPALDVLVKEDGISVRIGEHEACGALRLFIGLGVEFHP